LGSLRDDYVGLAGATPQFYSVALHRQHEICYSFLDVNFYISADSKFTYVLGCFVEQILQFYVRKPAALKL